MTTLPHLIAAWKRQGLTVAEMAAKAGVTIKGWRKIIRDLQRD